MFSKQGATDLEILYAGWQADGRGRFAVARSDKAMSTIYRLLENAALGSSSPVSWLVARVRRFNDKSLTCGAEQVDHQREVGKRWMAQRRSSLNEYGKRRLLYRVRQARVCSTQAWPSSLGVSPVARSERYPRSSNRRLRCCGSAMWSPTRPFSRTKADRAAVTVMLTC